MKARRSECGVTSGMGSRSAARRSTLASFAAESRKRLRTLDGLSRLPPLDRLDQLGELSDLLSAYGVMLATSTSGFKKSVRKRFGEVFDRSLAEGGDRRRGKASCLSRARRSGPSGIGTGDPNWSCRDQAHARLGRPDLALTARQP
jgi:hypothetical protein